MHRFPTKWIVIWLAVVAAAAMVAPTQALAATAALWHMDERSGTVMHDAVGNHDGTISHVRLGQPGFINAAFGFVRSDKSQVTVPSASDLNPGSGAFTVSLHVYATATPKDGDYDLVKKGSYGSSGGEYKVEMLQNGKAQCAFKGALRYAAVSGGPGSSEGALVHGAVYQDLVFGDPEGCRERLQQVDRSRLDRKQLAGRHRGCPRLRLHRRPARRGRPDPRDMTTGEAAFPTSAHPFYGIGNARNPCAGRFYGAGRARQCPQASLDGWSSVDGPPTESGGWLESPCG